MKKYLNEIKKWLIFWLSSFLTISLCFWIVFAAWSWSSSSPTTITRDASLYSDVWNTITAAKWNELVNTSKWKTISPSDTASFDITCERRMITSTLVFYADYVSAGQIVTYANTSWTFRDIVNTNKSVFSHWNWFTLTWLQYRCPTN